jgi:hypothetical protein
MAATLMMGGAISFVLGVAEASAQGAAAVP